MWVAKFQRTHTRRATLPLKTTYPPFATTNVGSVPHSEAQAVARLLIESLDIPAWPQLPRRTFLENMYTQFSAALPALVLDETKEKIYFNTRADLTQAITPFYEHILADDLDFFALPEQYAGGFYALLQQLPGRGNGWVKGQVTGPISFGLTVTDQDLRASLYHEHLVDVIVKNIALCARWQIRELKALRPGVILFVDEPYMASFGSAYISLSREQVVSLLDEVFQAIHDEGALAGVHCCANTDWSVLLDTQVDILNLDAYGYLNNLALYPEELGTFLERGGQIAWGMVPNNEAIKATSAKQLAVDLRRGIDQIVQRASQRGVPLPTDLDQISLLSPSCGLGSTSVEIAEQVIETLAGTASALRQTRTEA
jgi:methionine synthase II (cobalamin-independent)